MRVSPVTGLFAACMCVLSFASHADDWLPIDPDELKMLGEPKAPNAPAIYLYRQVDRNDDTSGEAIYYRIKILTEEGRKYANIEIPYSKSNESISSIRARTIRADGSVVEFNGAIYDKPIIQGSGRKLFAKTFTLPDVRVGSVIEYRYYHNLPNGYVFDSHWILSDELFTKYAKFSLVPHWLFALRYGPSIGLPEGATAPVKEGGRIRMEARNVPAFVTEDFMPPENQLKYRIDFVYEGGGNTEKEPAAYWKKFGRQYFKRVRDFANERRVMTKAVAEIVEPSDSAESKLRKIYARVQGIRNVSFERAKSEAEQKRDSLKENRDVGDVWERGYGNAWDITWLFLALAQTAGFDAEPVLVSTRDRYFFSDRSMNAGLLNSNVVLVKLDGKDVFLEPGIPFTPFGVLPWYETAVKAFRLEKDGGSWVSTPLPPASDSRILRKADLHLTPTGSLEGKVTVSFTGLAALQRRLTERNEDETDRKQYLEDTLEGDIPTGIDAELVNQPAWSSSEDSLTAEYELRVPGWANSVGQQMLLTMGLFSAREKNIFKHAIRVHPLYFNYPYETEDDIVIELPPGLKTASAPAAFTSDLKVMAYSTSAQEEAGKLRIKRRLTNNLLYLEQKYYSQVRDFYQTVRTHDEQQIVLAPAKPAGRK